MRNKMKQKQAIMDRANAALRDMYHNATVSYPNVKDDKQEAFNSWFEDAATFEIEYINDGGAYRRILESRARLLRAERYA